MRLLERQVGTLFDNGTQEDLADSVVVLLLSDTCIARIQTSTSSQNIQMLEFHKTAPN